MMYRIIYQFWLKLKRLQLEFHLLSFIFFNVAFARNYAVFLYYLQLYLVKKSWGVLLSNLSIVILGGPSKHFPLSLLSFYFFHLCQIPPSHPLLHSFNFINSLGPHMPLPIDNWSKSAFLHLLIFHFHLILQYFTVISFCGCYTGGTHTTAILVYLRPEGVGLRSWGWTDMGLRLRSGQL